MNPREELIQSLVLPPFISREKAESIVDGIAGAVREDASKAAESATRKVVVRGLWISSAIAGVTIIGSALIARRRG